MIKIHTCDPGYDHHDYYFRDWIEAKEWLNMIDWQFLDEKQNFGCYIEISPFNFWFSNERTCKNDSKGKAISGNKSKADA